MSLKSLRVYAIRASITGRLCNAQKAFLYVCSQSATIFGAKGWLDRLGHITLGVFRPLLLLLTKPFVPQPLGSHPLVATYHRTATVQRMRVKGTVRMY
eukprot:1191963-Prorocentrum_minimum.AAC.3